MMILGVVGRADNKVSVVDFSDLTKSVMPTIGFDVLLSGIPTAIVTRETGFGTLAYVTSEGNLSIINLNLPNGPAMNDTPMGIVPIGSGPNFVAVTASGSKAYALGGNRNIYVIDLANPYKPKITDTITLPIDCKALALAYDQQSLFVSAANESTILQVGLKKNADGTFPPFGGIAIPTLCIPFTILAPQGTIYAVSSSCTYLINTNSSYFPPSGNITAAAPSHDSTGLYLAYGTTITYIDNNRPVKGTSFAIPQGAVAISVGPGGSSAFLAPNTKGQFLTRIDLYTGTLTNAPLPFKGPYTALGDVMLASNQAARVKRLYGTAGGTTTPPIDSPPPKKPQKKRKAPKKKSCPCCKPKKSCGCKRSSKKKKC
jgi:DNA-binding beta-propeller fold protein YncE